MFGLLLLVTITRLAVADFDPDLHEKYLSMPRSSFVKYFNEQNYSWKMTEYDTNIRERYAPNAHFNYTDSIKGIPSITPEFEDLELPETFDARQHWPHCESIKDIYDQEDCEASFPFAVVSAISDRTCIQKNIHVRLSQQDFGCFHKGICDGEGNLYSFFAYWTQHGLVTQKCKPYNIHELKENICMHECVNNDTDYDKDKHFGDTYNSYFNRKRAIKVDLVTNGPVITNFPVYEDFYNYHRGIYEHKYGLFDGKIGVRVIGYGVEDGEKYWLVANSWGKKWGEQGLFKLKYNLTKVVFDLYITSPVPKN
ncbi:cathepsin B-like cysteine proteinase 5 [Spodoptera litura]|uniref:Cathepsin B-like cysteine proteinase 5 n=1 Tax=Spodoptera litura TaxID=69820 RepID=A0A9J7DR36_SPOLT|nr:cathepsin B-like cysteine proteinase 5 [Spodoptera litura]